MRRGVISRAAPILTLATATALIGCTAEDPRGTVFPDVPTATPVPQEYYVEFAPGERDLCDDPPISEHIAEVVASTEAGSVLARPQDLEGVIGADPKGQYERWQQLSDEDRIFHLCLDWLH